MTDGFINTVAQTEGPTDRRIYGVVVAQVKENVDTTGRGRVQVHLPGLPEIEPWARVAVPMSGANTGTYFIPQIGDEVLVAFHHGDIREAYIVGSLWNDLDRPPTLIPTDAKTKRIIRTPAGHEIEFDDLTRSIAVTNSTKQKVTLEADKITIETGGDTATITLEQSGALAIEAKQRLSLKAPSISIEGQRVEIKSSAETNINGGASCGIQATMVRIN
jgi:uncharacterized protein involved in type VI secretion and phage assembly